MYPKDYASVSAEVMAVSKDGIFYLNHAWTLFRSNLDVGSKWIHFDFPNGYVVSLLKHPKGNLFAGGWLSTDDGKHWSVNVGGGISSAKAIDSAQNILKGSSGYIYTSHDAGITWNSSSLKLTDGIITGIEVIGTRNAKRMVAELKDNTGYLELVWFQGINWIEKTLHTGTEYLVFGRTGFFMNHPQITHPELELLTADKLDGKSFLEPIYPSTEKLKA
jgi:hypothetical protein